MFGTRCMLTKMMRHVVAMTTTKWNQVDPSGSESGSKPLCLDFWDVTFLQPNGTKWIQVDPNQDPSHFAWISETTLFYNQVEPSGTESGTELLAWISCQNHLRPDSYYNTN